MIFIIIGTYYIAILRFAAYGLAHCIQTVIVIMIFIIIGTYKTILRFMIYGFADLCPNTA